VTTMHINL